uniref:8-amino-7-oxononanoate synthase n=1 Tax=Sorangium cellulosum TaxID=56 RepID=A0A3Q8I2A6_SORCE|nr:8-amino-7-oxononanoate synthase [Sorangium cellulosum]
MLRQEDRVAKIRHNNYFDTVDEVISDARKMGVLHLYTEDEALTGRRVRIKGRDLFHFGTTGYLGLEQDPRLKEAAIDAIRRYGTQFPLSKTYISHPLYRALEEKLERMYGHPVIITKNSTLGHIGVIPCVVRDEDAVILDQQVHWSVQNAAQLLKVRGIPVEMIRHSMLPMLEEKIQELSSRCQTIWYMADGVYSMYGDCAPVPELMKLSRRYPQLRLYFDDVHGMSWTGRNGCGYIMDQLGELPENVLLFGTLSKTFGASGAVLVCSDEKMHRRIKNFGGPLTFSAQLEPASVGAALASADIHLSPEIHDLQAALRDRIDHFNGLLAQTDLPLVVRNDSPVFFIGTGMPMVGYNFVNRLMDDGFYVNLGVYPAVAVKNTGVRITISRHNQREEMEGLVEAMVRHYPRALEETGTTKNAVRSIFQLPLLAGDEAVRKSDALRVHRADAIRSIDKDEWDRLMGRQSVFDWHGLSFLERAFRDNPRPEHNVSFRYITIRDEASRPVLVTFFCRALWKDDMLAPASVSRQLEERRKLDPYHLTSYVVSMGSLFTEGQHCYIDRSHPRWREAIGLMLDQVDITEERLSASTLVLRDFVYDEELNQLIHSHGFIKIDMPESCVVEDLSWPGLDGYLESLSARSRRHFKKDIQPYEGCFDVVVQEEASEREIDEFHSLYENVRASNFALNTFSFPRKLFAAMSAHPLWEFIVLYLKPEHDKRPRRLPVGVMFCYKNLGHTYVPSFIGMDYAYLKDYPIYRQLLFQTLWRARGLGFKKIDFGMTASFEKKKVGATLVPKVAYVQARDNFSMELMGAIQNR